MNNSALF